MNNLDSNKARIVVLGGGNGTSKLLTALLPLLDEDKIDSLHALVHMADDGGSTGRLREQYNVAAMGDLTKCLMALSSFHQDIRGQEFLQALDHRFTSGDFEGHTLRNVFFTSLEQTSNIDTALATMARILQIPKHSGVMPTTLTPLTQQVAITFDSQHNLLGEGQHNIAHQVNLQADPRWLPGDVKIVFAEGDMPLNPRAKEILDKATHIIVAPGHTYGTILPTLALPDLMRHTKQSQAKLIVVMTLLTTPHQTSGWTGEDFVRVYQSYLGRQPDMVIANSGSVEVQLSQGQEWVRFQESAHPYQLVTSDIVSTTLKSQVAGDKVPRAIVVHDSQKVRQELSQAIQTIAE